ncbi:uncharacterized protein LOC18430058 [Amborella trichopoda]|uniref:SWIM-type domain-containing protein n=1 Tax=Amborella trichopoda TaxID=13333 RepID=W1P4S7_AMBTC|nr:uncharacterized protein LOC18430058 [Amborella trichopoda]ERN01960.1 hypothetical protein AMTR_s00045p00056980 [Amborella trichopoda]|eukprot:XP_006840285.1 uncharacterized protein LOC18430058 [Amborella trichopoda]
MGENFKGFMKRSTNIEVLPMLFWNAARKVTIGGFEKIIFDIQCANLEAYDWIKNIPPKFWADAYFLGSRYSHLTSNMAESFNAWILSAREKPIITICEEIRIQLMTRFEEKRELGNTWSGMLVPKPQELLDTRKMTARFLHKVIFTMDTFFEIHYLGKKYAVNLMQWTCICRKWQLSGISCAHAIAAINHMHMDPTLYCLKYFTVEYFRRAFETPFAPVPDDIELTGIYNRTVLPPRTTRFPGRLKKQRRISETEHPITRPLKCKRCDAEGHNRRTCKEPI